MHRPTSRRMMVVPVNERTLVLIKPDGVQRLLAGRILARYEDRGLKLVALKLMRVSADLAERHYAVHRDEAVLPRPRRLHHQRAARGRGPRGPERDRRRPGDERRDPAARGGAGLDPRRLRPRDRPEPGPCLGQPGERGRRDRPVVRAGEPASTTSARSTAGCCSRSSRRPDASTGRRPGVRRPDHVERVAALLGSDRSRPPGAGLA